MSFPSISAGAYRYPLNDAAKIAVETVLEFARDEAKSVKEIVFVLYDGRTYGAYEKVLENKISKS